ncbi:cofilin/tropomyosin-type actin-binding protein [Ceratobasidium sp. AG-Ba]|nr:cofilin/tropomyosin-type actin-binding protein [Ceratobasidium sp. AG-Ba]QRV91370.1 cofilin/tropomyosin-type actin-binding protein [Ceratobasidium sp. AG-Ba]QRW05432.1 cofilin/tropomyosin-type actin-binding protein [Ceratobasidium sp. AG-Ba]
MADVSQPEIRAAYDDVRLNKSETNWLVLKYESPRSNVLKLVATGTGGLTELREGDGKKHLGDEDIAYAYVRVTYANDKESKREKFILVTWIGENVGGLRKGKVSVHLADVKKVLAVASFEVAAREPSDLAEEPIVIRLRKAGGASYDGV